MAGLHVAAYHGPRWGLRWDIGGGWPCCRQGRHRELRWALLWPRPRWVVVWSLLMALAGTSL